jgi:uncharacterized protein YcaQ
MTQVEPRKVSLPAARRIAVRAALLEGRPLPPTSESVVKVVRHFGGIQIDPTRTVERTQHLVLWSRLAHYDRALLERLLADHRLFEWNAFVTDPERVPEMQYVARTWPRGDGDWIRRARAFLAGNAEFRQSILDQLRAEGPLQSRQIDDSKVKVGWESTGWTHGKNASRMLEFMSVKMDVAIAGRVGQERLWDLAKRVIPDEGPRDVLTEDEYEEGRVMRAMARFGVATFKEVRSRAYGLSIPKAKALLARLVDDGRLEAVRLELPGSEIDAFTLPRADEAEFDSSRTTLLSPFDPIVYDRERTERLFDFKYKLEMYVPKSQRKFGHFVLPILHADRLVGRLDSERNRKTNELVVRQVHWEARAPSAATRAAVDDAISALAAFVKAG